jgi:hypothetical protein
MTLKMQQGLIYKSQEGRRLVDILEDAAKLVRQFHYRVQFSSYKMSTVKY